MNSPVPWSQSLLGKARDAGDVDLPGTLDRSLIAPTRAARALPASLRAEISPDALRSAPRQGTFFSASPFSSTALALPGAPPATPRAVVSLTLTPAAPLDAVAGMADALAGIGVSHVCLSPLTPAREDGAPIDFTTLDPALGGEAGLRRTVASLRRRRLGVLLALAPGRMAIGGAENRVWLDILEWGRDSLFANVLDVDRRGGDPSLRNRLLVPLLETPYGEALESGALTLTFDAQAASFQVAYRHHRFPICPRDYPEILAGDAHAGFADLRDRFKRLATQRLSPGDGHVARSRLRALAGEADGREAIAGTLLRFDSESPEGRARLHALLEKQSYRLAARSTGADDVNWRRAGLAPDVAAVKVERADVFDHVHALPLRLYGEGLIDGLRILEPDDLADPAAYFRRLQLKLAALATGRPEESAPAPYIVADTPLAHGQDLPRGFDIQGTAGADFRDEVCALLHDPSGAAPLAELWNAVTGERSNPADQRAAIRRDLLRDVFGADLEVAARALGDVAASDLRTRDITVAAIRRVLIALLAAFPISRTHADIDGRPETDAAAFAEALEAACATLSPADRAVARAVDDWLGGQAPRAIRDIEASGAREYAIARFQLLAAQLARAAEAQMSDRFGRLLSRAETGADARAFALDPKGFHAAMRRRDEGFARSLLATQSEGLRLGEDARARLAVLSELPKEWGETLRRLREAAAPFRTVDQTGRPVPSPAQEVTLYQMLIAAWPSDGDAQNVSQFAALAQRIGRDLRARAATAAEAETLEAFVKTLLREPAAEPVREHLARFAARIAPAGALNALSQTVLKFTAPGVPEMAPCALGWDLYPGAREDRLSARASAALADPHLLLETWTDGRVKEATLARLLDLRRAMPELFAAGTYRRLEIEGPRAAQAIAFARQSAGATLLVVTSRLAAGLLPANEAKPLIPASRWEGTCLILPPELRGMALRNVLTGRAHGPATARLDMADLLAALPCAAVLGSHGEPA